MVTTPTIGQTGWGVVLNNALNDLQTQIDGTYSSAGGALTGGITTDLAVRSAFFKTTSTTEHAVTIYQAATSGTGVGLNLISDNPDDSTMYLTGQQDDRGTLKITHKNPGPGATDDASSAAISIDLQRNGMGGTAAQGIFLTATEGATTGNLIVLRNNGRDDFVVKGTGRAGVRMDTGEVPESALEVKQGTGDTTTVGLVVTGTASTTAALMQVKTSAGTAVLEVGASGAIVHRAISFYTNSLQLGATSSDFGGATGSVISMKNATAVPTTNPTGGGAVEQSLLSPQPDEETDPLAEARRLLAEDEQQRMQACAAEIETVLDKYGLRLIVTPARATLTAKE
jgi:hypothetical protein